MLGMQSSDTAYCIVSITNHKKAATKDEKTMLSYIIGSGSSLTVLKDLELNKAFL